jgi:hypothetical protein
MWRNSNPFSIEFISSTSNRDYGYQYLIFTDDVSVMSHLGSNFMGGLGAWKQDVVVRLEVSNFESLNFSLESN